MTINIDFRTKGTCDMASHAHKMDNVEKMFRTYTKVNVQKKHFYTTSRTYLTIEKQTSLTMPYHFTHNIYQTSPL